MFSIGTQGLELLLHPELTPARSPRTIPFPPPSSFFTPRRRPAGQLRAPPSLLLVDPPILLLASSSRRPATPSSTLPDVFAGRDRWCAILAIMVRSPSS